TFSTLGQSDIVDAKSVMSSLSYTLIATAAGLLVAIPAMVIYNLLSRRVDVLLALWDKDHGHGA
ncbi:MAG: MotA/TolQ/ExbB proton channel family protein, partial [Campylobacterales bacterium]